MLIKLVRHGQSVANIGCELGPEIVQNALIDCSPYRRKQCERVLIVSHGLTIRFEQFEAIANPDNGEIVTIGPRGSVAQPTHENGRWAASGLRPR